MDWLTVIGISVVGVLLWEYFTTILPAKRKASLAVARYKLVECLHELNENALLSAKISNGDYIHDSYYKFLIAVLCDSRLISLKRISDLKWGPEDYKKVADFQNEIEALGPKTKETIRESLYSSSKILFLRQPVRFIVMQFVIRKPMVIVIFLIRVSKFKINYRLAMEKFSKFLTVSAVDREIKAQHHCRI